MPKSYRAAGLLVASTLMRCNSAHAAGNVLNPGAVGATVLGLCAVQVLAAGALWTGRARFGAWLDLLCPLVILTLCVGRMSLAATPAALSSVATLEWAFLAVNAVVAVLAAAELWRHRAQAVMTDGRASWLVWWVNSIACAVMVYLTFYFRLF